MDESSDPKPHPVVHASITDHAPAPTATGEKLSIWFFVGILTLAYGLVLTATGVWEHFGHQPETILANLEPTLWWGLFLLLFGLFYTVKFRPGKK
jgi:hypothetical protein